MGIGRETTLEFREVALRQRACRQFRSDPVPPTVLHRVLTAATRAPSAENRQPWRFVAVRSATTRDTIVALTRTAWETDGRDHAREHLPPALFGEVDRGVREGLATAPVLVVAGVDVAAAAPGALGPSIWPAVQNLLLAATDEGLGSALTTLATRDGDALRAAVGFAPDVRPVAVVPLGTPLEPLAVGRRQPLSAVAWLDRVGVPLPEK